MTTTANDLLDRARLTLSELEASHSRVTKQEWDTFDQSVYRLLHELVTGRVGWRHGDPHASALRLAFRDYPWPLQPVGDQPDYTPREAARFLGVSEAAIRRSVRAGALLAASTDAGFRIPWSEVTVNGPVHPAASDDPHPLSRLACTVGTLTDLLVVNRTDPALPELQAASATTIAQDFLSVVKAAATRTMSLCDPAVADRPLAIARYAANVLDQLPAAGHLLGLQNFATPSPDRGPLCAADELDVAIYRWSRAARSELRHGVPGVEVLKDVNRQGIHLYAALHSVLSQSAQLSAMDISEHLRQSALTLQAAADAWVQTTTGAPPSRDYVQASRRLYANLAAITTVSSQPSRDTYEALLRGASMLASVTSEATPWADRLLESEVLFVHARHATPNARRLGAALSGRMVAATRADVPALPFALWEAQRATTEMARALPPSAFSCADAATRLGAPQL